MTVLIGGTFWRRAFTALFLRRRPFGHMRPAGRAKPKKDPQALLELLINSPELIASCNSISGEPEAEQDDHEDQTVPHLKAPANRVEDHNRSVN